ncbi:MAG: MFS transporter [Candidatus Omnitrophota bacterium]
MNPLKNKTKQNISILSWSLYDLANQFFILNVVSLYFPRWLTIEKGSPEIFYSLAFGFSMILVAIFAPFLGTLSDKQNKHKAFLILFTVISIIFTLLLGMTSNVFLCLIIFAIANFGCQEATIFYNSLMKTVAPKNKLGLVSGIGKMFGYGGAVLALYLTRPVVTHWGYPATFLVTGIMFLIFSLPCIIFVKDLRSKYKPKPNNVSGKEYILQTFRQLKKTLTDNDKFQELKSFFKAVFFGLCAINTFMLFMAVYAAKVFGLTETQLISLLAFSTIFAVAGSFASGFISDFFGYKKSLIGVFILWIICLCTATCLNQPFHWLVGGLAGISVGATWVILRALVIKLAPEDELGEAFGLFNLITYASGIVGPVYWGLILLYFTRFGSAGYRFSFFSLVLFFIITIVLLLKMDNKSSRKKY